RRRRGARRRHDRQARRAVRRAGADRAGAAGTPEAARVKHITRRRAAVALLGGVFVLAAIPATPQAPRTTSRTPDPPLKIDIRAQPIAGFDARGPSRRQFGELLFRGGLELTSPYKEFGGISAIRVAA